jgi:aerobic-type carbon monoxide dehydrogenase small subunit (CoxS/CutS family)
VDLRINGKARTVNDAYDDGPLLWALRDDLGLTGTHYGCGVGKCGSCMVLLDGAATRSCQLPSSEATGEIVTIEGLASRGGPTAAAITGFTEVPLQCMWCLPGHLMTAVALLADNPSPTPAEIETAIAENLCRCGGYNQIRKAIARAIEIRTNS